MSVIIRLQNLPMSANASNIRRFFAGLSIPEGGVHIVGGNDGDAFIAFATDEDARKAMLLDRQAINGAPVRLFLSSKTEMQSIIDSARSSALFSGAVVSQPQTIPQKTETMQALDVTAPTLPSSFPSYRNGTIREPYTGDRQDSYGYPHKRAGSPTANNLGRAPFEISRGEPYPETGNAHQPRINDRSGQPEPNSRDRAYDYDRSNQYPRYDNSRERNIPAADYNVPTREPGTFEGSSRISPQPYRSYYGDTVYDRRPSEQYPSRPKDAPRDESRTSYSDTRYGRLPPERPSTYDDGRSLKPVTDRFTDSVSRDPREAPPEVSGSVNHQSYPPDRRPPPIHSYEREHAFPPARPHGERDFSIRPPWLNEDVSPHGAKRGLPSAPEPDDYPRKRRPLPPNSRPPIDYNNPVETEFVVRVTLPLAEVGIKAVFEILRGVHIVPKWGIRVEEDALQRPTGYVFIMMSARDSFERALAYDGRIYKTKTVRVAASSSSEFYKVTDSNFLQKCPPEIAKKLPSPDQPVSAPHHADGCLEVAELPPDTTRVEVVRFLGAPGLTVSDITLAKFAPSDRSASKSPSSIRALVSLPSAKDIEILLSAKARPLRPDGAFPPVRLTPISRLQLEGYMSLRIDDKHKLEPPKPESAAVEPAGDSKPPCAPLTCAYLSGLSRFMKDFEVLRLFPSVLIPGDAICMVGPDNTSAYIDFISENNCRRAMADISDKDSKAKLSHPAIRIEAISRAEKETKLGTQLKSDEPPSAPTSDSRLNRPPRDRDPRDLGRPSWETRPPPRVGRHPSPIPPFRSRSPQLPNRSKFDEPYYDNNLPPQAFDDARHTDLYGGAMRRPRPPPELTHPPVPVDYMHPPRPSEPMLLPQRRPGVDFVTVHLGNLPSSVTVDQLAGMMRDYYFVPGSIRLRRDIQGVPTGEALVDFNSSYDGDRVIRDLSGYRLAGRPLALQYDRRL